MEVYNIDCDKLEAKNWIEINKKGKSVDWWEYYTISLENSIKWDAILKEEVKNEEERIKIMWLYSLTTRWT